MNVERPTRIGAFFWLATTGMALLHWPPLRRPSFLDIRIPFFLSAPSRSPEGRRCRSVPRGASRWQGPGPTTGVERRFHVRTRVGMRLERLEIAGFKSFSDRSELAFDRGRHRDRRAQRLRQEQRRRRHHVGAWRAERQEPARRQDGGRHLQRQRRAQADGDRRSASAADRRHRTCRGSRGDRRRRADRWRTANGNGNGHNGQRSWHWLREHDGGHAALDGAVEAFSRWPRRRGDAPAVSLG